MKTNKISILITVHNSGSTILETLQSLKRQLKTPDEVVLVDDGSTDLPNIIIEDFEKLNLQYYKIEHVGRSAALNYGLTKCSFDWIGILDSDDIVHPDWLSSSFSNNNRKTNDVIINRASFFDKDGIVFSTKLNISNEDILLHQYFPHSSAIFNKNFIIENGGYNTDLKVSIDYDLFMRLFHKLNFIYNKEILVFCRISKGSMSRSNFQNTRNSIYTIQKLYYSKLQLLFANMSEKKIQKLIIKI